MRKFLTASADTTLYERYPTLNSGFDEILEIGKVARPEDIESAYSASATRVIVNFILPVSGTIPSSAEYYLNLKIAHAQQLVNAEKLYVHKVSGSWKEGNGYFTQQTKNPENGATWRQKEPFISWSLSGSDYYTMPSASFSLEQYPLQDVRLNISSIITPVISQSLDWNGLLIKFDNATETDANNRGIIKFFSRQTHTIHQPTLEVAWDDSTFITGSLKKIPNANDIKVLPKNAKEKYTQGSKEKIRFIVRDAYPTKNFDATLRYKNTYYLPTSSYYSITDKQANVVIYPADQYSKLSCDATSSFFILDTSYLYKNRYYSINLIIDNGDADTMVTSDVFTFLVQ